MDKVTDVLSYPSLDGIKGQALAKADYPFDIDEEGKLVIGSIVICCQRAKEQAEEYGHSYERELHYLIVHGVMHCLGYDHIEDEDRAEMREKEEFILGKLGIVRE
jgi:probable rRNA maturation factor